jgi:hypothetical protein
VKKHPPTVSSIGYPDIDILYSGFLASQRKIESENDSLDYAQDIEKLLENIYRK